MKYKQQKARILMYLIGFLYNTLHTDWKKMDT